MEDQEYFISGSWTYGYPQTARYWGENVITSGEAKITNISVSGNNFVFEKETVLKTEKTPADFLLDYSKLFGLYFIKDRYDKSIFICTRNTFFNGVVND